MEGLGLGPEESGQKFSPVFYRTSPPSGPLSKKGSKCALNLHRIMCGSRSGQQFTASTSQLWVEQLKVGYSGNMVSMLLVVVRVTVKCSLTFYLCIFPRFCKGRPRLFASH